MRMLWPSVRYDTLNDGVGIGSNLGAIVFRILLVRGRALIGVALRVARLGSISAHVVDRRCRTHRVDRTHVQQR